MKKYYIFTSELIPVSSRIYQDQPSRYYYRYSPYSCLGFAKGKERVWKLFGRYGYSCVRESFSNDTGTLCSSFSDIKENRYIITDCNGTVIPYSFFSDMDPLRRSRKQPRSAHPHQKRRHIRYVRQLRCSPTPEEIRNYRDTYGYYFSKETVKKYSEGDWEIKSSRKGRSWKDQTKRKHQWKIRK